jgi:hypothetical protein
VATHSIGHDEEPQVDIKQQAVLVGLAHMTDVRHSMGHQHGVPSYPVTRKWVRSMAHCTFEERLHAAPATTRSCSRCDTLWAGAVVETLAGLSGTTKFWTDR